MPKLTTEDLIPLKNIKSIPRYWESLKPQNDIGGDLETSWKKQIEFLDNISAQNNVVVMLINTFTNRCLYMSDKLKVLSGIDPSCYLAETGMEYSVSRIHPNHITALMQVNRRFMNYYADNNKKGTNDVSLCINYLHRNGNDEYVQVLQRLVVLEVSDNGMPALTLYFINYVGHIKKSNSLSGVIVEPNKVTIFNFDPDKNCFDPAVTISDQEKKIIQMLSQGLDSRTMSKKLKISPHTVNTHRRNLIKKTECLDTTGVVAFAKLINLI